MSELQDTTGLHESTVQNAEQHARQPRRRGPDQRPRTTLTRSVKVDPRVMKVAKRLVNGDVSRITIVDATTVIVR